MTNLFIGWPVDTPKAANMIVCDTTTLPLQNLVNFTMLILMHGQDFLNVIFVHKIIIIFFLQTSLNGIHFWKSSLSHWLENTTWNTGGQFQTGFYFPSIKVYLPTCNSLNNIVSPVFSVVLHLKIKERFFFKQPCFFSFIRKTAIIFCSVFPS